MGSHSQKIMLASGLISTPNGMVIRTEKNVSRDGHSMVNMSKVQEEREIVMRNIKHFHYFRCGAFS